MEVKQVIVIRRDLKMRRGKEIAQGAHASIAWLAGAALAGLNGGAVGAGEVGVATVALDPVAVRWLTSGGRKITVQVPGEAELVEVHRAAVAAGLRSHLIRDAGHTEFAGVPTLTAVAVGPDLAEAVDRITGALALY
ncbi:MAG: aminoacyl-tRNA hydrolase [Myxococcota bacterium]